MSKKGLKENQIFAARDTVEEDDKIKAAREAVAADPTNAEKYMALVRQCSRYLTYWEMVTKLKTLFPILMMRDMISSQKSHFFMITQLRLQQLPRELNRKVS